MKIVIYEDGVAGHRLTYLRLMLPAIRAAADEGGATVEVLLPAGADRAVEFREQIAPAADGVTVTAALPPVVKAGSQWSRASSRLRQFADAVRGSRADHVFVPTADALVATSGMARMLGRTFGLPAGVELEGAVHRCSWGYPPDSPARRLKQAFILRAIRLAPWRRVLPVDLLGYERIQADGGSLASRSALLPNPLEPAEPIDCAEARRRLGVPEGGRYLGVAGVINHRKAVDRLIVAFRAAAPPDARLLLVGKQDDAIRRQLAEASDLTAAGRVVQIDRYVTDDELRLATAAMDVMAVTYPRHVSISDILLRSVSAGRPVLGSDYGWIGRIITQFGLGWTCRLEDPGDLARAVAASLGGGPTFAFDGRRDRLMAFHAASNYGATWAVRLRERLGLPPDPALMPWSAVTGGQSSATT